MEELLKLAAEHPIPTERIPAILEDIPYTRIPIRRDGDVEVVVIGFAFGQTSSVHDHRASRCIVRVVRGRVLETLFRPADEGMLEPIHSRILSAGSVTGLEIGEIHQLSNLAAEGSVLLNVYSPPFED